ncbi:MAG: hypothetical protein FWD26_07835 [Treponema sp.]|nr:hypothetical protein [Treponema sp.]
MKDTFKFARIITLAVIIGFSIAHAAAAQSTLSGVYTLEGHSWTFTFTGNNFSMYITERDTTISGTYRISGSTVTLTSSGFANANTRRMTIVNATTLRDWDGDTWVKPAPLSGVYRLQGHETWTFTFTGTNNFAMYVPERNTTINGTYTVSGSTVTLTSSSFANSNTRRMTIINPTTLRDWDGDTWTSAPATSALSGVYRLQGHESWTFTFTGTNVFAMYIPERNTIINGTYTVSGSTVTLTSSDFANANTRRMTIVNATTLRDWDNDTWIKR